jgi:hypothetical protein
METDPNANLGRQKISCLTCTKYFYTKQNLSNHLYRTGCGLKHGLPIQPTTTKTTTKKKASATIKTKTSKKFLASSDASRIRREQSIALTENDVISSDNEGEEGEQQIEQIHNSLTYSEKKMISRRLKELFAHQKWITKRTLIPIIQRLGIEVTDLGVSYGKYQFRNSRSSAVTRIKREITSQAGKKHTSTQTQAQQSLSRKKVSR